MKNTGQGDDMKWDIEKNEPWPNSVNFVHYILPPQMDSFHSDGCACSAEETNKNMEHITPQQGEQMGRL